MSVYMLEQVLYDLGVKRDSRKAFADAPDAFLAKYRLHEHEALQVKSFDVRALFDSGVNPMLTMGFWQMCSPTRSLRDYVLCMNGKG